MTSTIENFLAGTLYVEFVSDKCCAGPEVGDFHEKKNLISN